MTLDALRMALTLSWSRETSYCPKAWSKENPAAGQCLVTALIVQDHFGGYLLSGTVNKVSHWWNELSSGEEIDLTIQQFGEDILKTKGHRSLRKPMRARRYPGNNKAGLNSRSVEKRYRLLYSAVQHHLLKTA
jgi:hypothetical protein